MANLTKETAAPLGLAFVIEGEAHAADPDIPIYQAALTLNGHTVYFTGKSEDDVLDQAEQLLVSNGLYKRPKPEEPEEVDEP